MLYSNKLFYSVLLGCCITVFSCKTGTNTAKEDVPAVTDVRTPVTVVSISSEPITEYIELNATSAFLQKSYAKANANGYLQSVNTKLGDYVANGQVLFTIKTKESQSLGNAV